MKSESLPLDFTADESLWGFRLQRLEVFNWGTFDGRVWTLRADGRTPQSRFEMSATPGDALDGEPLVVLVDGGSASAGTRPRGFCWPARSAGRRRG